MTMTETNNLLTIIALIWFLTIGRSIVIMIGGSKIFMKAHKGEKSAYYPIVNLFSMLEVTEISTFYGILFFIPVINVIVLLFMSYKLGKVFNCGTLMKAGLILLPVIFYPLLAFGNNDYKSKSEEFFKLQDNAKNDSINLLSEAEIEAQNNATDVETINVDSIFKSRLEQMEVVAPYKAAKIDQETMDKLKDSSFEENAYAPIERVETPTYEDTNVPEAVNQNSEEQTKSKFLGELEHKDDVEFIDL